jgi:putative transcriptional regulator
MVSVASYCTSKGIPGLLLPGECALPRAPIKTVSIGLFSMNLIAGKNPVWIMGHKIVVIILLQKCIMQYRRECADHHGDMQLKTERKFKSDAFKAIHASASALAKAGAIDKTTMRSFDESCLAVPASIKPHEIKKLREHFHVSQSVFARYLNTSESTVEKWETGAKKPSGMALKLLAVVQKHGLKMLA